MSKEKTGDRFVGRKVHLSHQSGVLLDPGDVWDVSGVGGGTLLRRVLYVLFVCPAQSSGSGQKSCGGTSVPPGPHMLLNRQSE